MSTNHHPDHQRISFTAKLVALGRSGTEIPFAREISELVGARAISENLAKSGGLPRTVATVIAPFVEARYLSMVSAIKRSGVQQVLEFASGVSLRGLAMTLAEPTLTYIETDLPDLTAEKVRITREILDRHHLVTPPHYHVSVANILIWNEIAPIIALLAPGKPVAVVHEGLFMYLSPSEKAAAGQNIARILDRFGGVWITPDFSAISNMTHLPGETSADFSKLTSVIEEQTGRNFNDYSFSTEQEAIEFCGRLGFKVTDHPMLDGTFKLTSLPETAGPELLSKLQPLLKLWEMRRA